MSIINGLLNQRGVQRFGSEFASTLAAGEAVVVYHPNGNLYAIFARNYNLGVLERRLYWSSSTDNGNTWSYPPTQITSGAWDDEPTAVVMDPGNPSSLIGVVYNSGTVDAAPVLRRFTINTSGVVQTPFDALFPGGQSTAYSNPQLVPNSNGFTVFLLASGFSASVFSTTNTVFTNNSWTAIANITGGSGYFFGASSYQITHMRVWAMSNYSNQYCFLGAVRTAMDGATNAGSFQNGIPATVRADLFFTVSTDDGSTWSSAVNLTNYSGSPGIDLIGIDSVISVAGIDCNDGTIAIGYQEGLASQVLSDSSSLPTPTSAHPVTQVLYHAGYNYLLVAGSTVGGGLGGLDIYDLTGQTRTRLYNSSSPAIWSNNIRDMAISADGNYIVLAEDESFDIIDTGGSSTIADWTVTGIRSSGSPSPNISSFVRCKFDNLGSNPYRCYVAYSTGATGGLWGFYIDVSNPVALTELQGASGGVNEFIIRSVDVIWFTSGAVGNINRDTGDVITYTSSGSNDFTALLYDDVNNQIFVAGTVGSDQGVWTSDPTNSFHLTAAWLTSGSPSYVSGNPTVPTDCFQDLCSTFVGEGFILGFRDGAGVYQKIFYSFHEQQQYGPFLTQWTTQQNELYSQSEPGRTPDPLPNGWNPGVGAQDAIAFNYYKGVGRLRWNKFPYNAGTQTITTLGQNFYDLLNLIRFDPTTPYQLRSFDLTADSDNNVYGVFRRNDLTRTQQLLSTMNGLVDTDAYKLQMQACVRNTSIPPMQSRGRIQQTYVYTASMKGRVVLSGHVSMRAHISPYYLKSISMKAAIANFQDVTVEGTYSIATAQAAQALGVYYIANGMQSGQSMSMGAYIARNYTAQVYGKYAIVIGPDATQQLALNVTYRGTYQLQMMALIALPSYSNA